MFTELQQVLLLIALYCLVLVAILEAGGK